MSPLPPHHGPELTWPRRVLLLTAGGGRGSARGPHRRSAPGSSGTPASPAAADPPKPRCSDSGTTSGSAGQVWRPNQTDWPADWSTRLGAISAAWLSERRTGTRAQASSAIAVRTCGSQAARVPAFGPYLRRLRPARPRPPNAETDQARVPVGVNALPVAGQWRASWRARQRVCQMPHREGRTGSRPWRPAG